jgi:hypothetical protein
MCIGLLGVCVHVGDDEFMDMFVYTCKVIHISQWTSMTDEAIVETVIDVYI